MRRVSEILAVSFLALAACRGGEAREARSGTVARRDTTTGRTIVGAGQGTVVDTVASEVDVPWAIALLLEGRAPVGKEAGHVAVADRGPDMADQPAGDRDLEVTIDRASSAHKSPSSKSCGVVNRRT